MHPRPYVAAVEEARADLDEAERALSDAIVAAHLAGEPVASIARAARLTRPTIYSHIERFREQKA